jgi:hypothetical protein
MDIAAIKISTNLRSSAAVWETKHQTANRSQRNNQGFVSTLVYS